MDIALNGYYYRLKRYWKRKNYERLGDATRPRTTNRKVKLGGVRSKKRSNLIKIRRAPKLKFMFILPLKLVAKFHEAYTLLAKKENLLLENTKEKKAPKRRPVPMMLSANMDAMVDVKMVMELYERMASKRELPTIDSD